MRALVDIQRVEREAVVWEEHVVLVLTVAVVGEISSVSTAQTALPSTRQRAADTNSVHICTLMYQSDNFKSISLQPIWQKLMTYIHMVPLHNMALNPLYFRVTAG